MAVDMRATVWFSLSVKITAVVFIAALSFLGAQAFVGGENTMHEGFVDVREAVPGVVTTARYAGADNFIGAPVTGYEADKVIVSKPVAAALVKVQADIEQQGYSLKLFDGYRPQRAVDHFMRWIADTNDIKNKTAYYPDVRKADLVSMGYIAEKSGHSRGGSVDITLVRRDEAGTWHEVNMGSPWDLFDEKSHAGSIQVSASAQENRAMLANVMLRHGFKPYSEEWWHFTLVDEPYPETYFDFPIR